MHLFSPNSASETAVALVMSEDSPNVLKLKLIGWNEAFRGMTLYRGEVRRADTIKGFMGYCWSSDLYGPVYNHIVQNYKEANNG